MLIPLIFLMGCDLLDDKLGHSCNMMYAPDMVNILMTTDGMLDASDAVMVLIEGGDVPVTCTYEGDNQGAICDDNTSHIWSEDGMLNISLWEQTPKEVSVSVWLEDNDLSEGTWSGTPEYIEDEPNGEGCGFRQFGELVLDISSMFNVG